MWYNGRTCMLHFPTDHMFILPHAEEYRKFYSISLKEVLATLNKPDLHEGLTTDYYTSEKQFRTHRVYVYYLTIPLLQASKDEAYAINLPVHQLCALLP